MKTKEILFALAALLMTAGCKKFIQIDAPKTQLVTSAVFADDKTAISAVAGMYSYIYQFNNSFSTFGGYSTTILTGLSGDELTRPSLPTDSYLTNNIPEDEGNNASIWQSCYSAIYQANSIVEGLKNSSNITPALKNQLIGEALFIRAFSHFYLINFYGDVPLITQTDAYTNIKIGRTPAADVYKQILDDLTQATTLLVNDYTTYFSGERVRANRWVVTAFLARVYLYRGDWVNAEASASTIINNTSLFGLVNDLNAVFLKNSKEAIWQFLTYSGKGYTTLGVSLIPSTATSIPTYTLTDGQLGSFESNDLRKINWTKATTVNGITYSYPYKYKNRSATLVNSGEYDMVLRLAEQYLIRSEARVQLNKLGDASSGAIGDLNKVRARAGLLPTTATDKTTLLLAIEKERRNEFFSEWGHRWFDLKRTNRADAVLSASKSGWVATASLYPIPSVEQAKNPLLTPNPGY